MSNERFARPSRTLFIVGSAFVLTAVVMIAVGTLGVLQIRTLRAIRVSVQRSIAVRTETENILSLLKDAETGQRGFVLTGRVEYLAPYNDAVSELPTHQRSLRALTDGNVAEQKKARALEEVTARTLVELREAIDVRQRQGFAAASRLVERGDGRRLMGEARALSAAIVSDEDRDIAAQRGAEEERARYATTATLATVTIAILLLAGAGVLMIRGARERERQRAARSSAEEIARAARESEERAREELTDLTRIQQASNRLVGAADLYQLLDEILAVGIEISRADMGNIQLVEDGALRVAAQRGFDAAFLAHFDRISAGEAACGHALQLGHRIIVEDVSRSAIFADERLREAMAAAGVKAVQSTPLVSRSGPTLGVFSTHYRHAPHRPTERELFMLDILARQAADLIERQQAQAAERQARRDAEAANRAKDQFLAVVSHELRTPLNAILGWAEMLQAGRVPPDRRERAISSIAANAHRQASLVNELLEVSRIVSGKVVLHRAPVDLGEVIRGATEALVRAAEAKNISLRVDLDSARTRYFGDAPRLQQVITNLVSNAIKFTPGGGRVEVTLRTGDGHYELCVRDSGEGISAAFLPFVFDSFRQADDSIARRHGGLGLGLAIVKHLVEAHGGSVHAESPGEGRGATFTARLPFVDASVAGHSDVPSATSPEIASSTRVSALEGVTVLVVDDDNYGLEMAGATLRSCGANVIEASSAPDARRLLSAHHVDVLVSDIAMPGEDGFSMIRKIRTVESEIGRRVPAIALTAFARSQDRDDALAAGFDVHLPKPLRARILVDAICSLLDRAGARQ